MVWMSPSPSSCSLHGRADVSVRVGVELVVAVVRIVGREGDKALFREFLGIGEVRFPAQARRFRLPDFCRLMQAEHSWALAFVAYGYE